jgi:hypothetical protein
MKKIFLLALLSISFQFSKAQTSNWLWAENSDGGEYEYGYGVFVDTGGHIFTSGRLSNSGTFGALPYNASGTSPYVEKFDTSGNGIWVNATAFSGFDYCEGFCIDNKDNSYVTGISGGSMLTGKFDKNGITKWAIIYNGPQPAGLGIAADNAGYVYLLAVYNPGSVTMNSITVTNSGSYGATFIAKLDSNGNCLWAKNIQSAGGYVFGRDIVVDNLGNFYMIGDYAGTATIDTITTPAATGVANFFISKFDTSGHVKWVTTSTNSFACDFGGSVGLALDSCNNIYVTGAFENTAQFGTFSFNSAGNEDGFVAKLNNSGQWQWVNTISSSGRDAGFSICTDKHNEVFVGGDYGGNANLGNGVTITGAGGGFVAKYANSTGKALWALGGIGSTAGHIYGMAVDKLGYAYALGDFSGSVTFGTHTVTCNNGTSNIFLAKLDTVAPREIIPKISKTYCPGETTTIHYTIVGSFDSGNTFTVQLSDSTGSFVNDTSIGSILSSTAGTITITIPSNTPSGSSYLIRVVSDSPTTSSYVNGCGAYYNQNVYPNDFYVTIGSNLNVLIVPDSATVCSGGPVLLTVNDTGVTYKWTSDGDTNTLANTDTITVNPTTTTTYYVAVSNSYCSGIDSVVVKTNAVLPLTVQPAYPAVATTCLGVGIALSVDTAGKDYVWSPALTVNPSTGDTVIATPLETTTYTVSGINSSGCTVTGYDTVHVGTGPSKPTISESGDVLTSSATQGNQWLRDDTVLAGATNQTYTVTISGYYQVEAKNPVNGCSTTSDSILITTGINHLSVINEQISVYPNPTGGEIFVNINSSVADVKDWNLQITDVLGGTVYTKLSLNYSNDIDLSNLPGGVYFITVINKTGQAVFPVIKQN